MTLEEIKAKYGDDEDGYVYCSRCPLEDYDDYCPEGCDGRVKAYGALKEYFDVHGEPKVTEPTNPKEDIINHPSHYCREGGMECLDEMELIFGREALKYFCLCNAWKYRYRASAKNGDEDLKKSDFYIKKYKELIESETFPQGDNITWLNAPNITLCNN